MKYTLDTKPYRQFFNYHNTFHFPDESGSLVDAGMMAGQSYALFNNGNLYM